MEESALNEDYNTKAVVKTEPTKAIEDVKMDFKIKLENEELDCEDQLKIEESTYIDDIKSETTDTSFTNPNIKSESLHLHELKTEPIDDVRKLPDSFYTSQNNSDNMATEIKDSSMNNGAKGTKKLFECPVCKFQTKFRNSLSVHMQIHSGDKPFQCSLCLRSYNRKCGLKVHMLRHEKYKCSICNNTRQRNLKEHTAEPYRCSTCKYGRNDRVKAHALLHAGKSVSHSE